MSFRPDILVEIHYDMDEPSATRIFTNAKLSVIDEIVEAWMQDQVFRKSDPSSEEMEDPPILDVYVIRIGLRIEDDALGYESTARNLHLTLGIMSQVLGLLGRGSLGTQPLSQRPAV